MGSSFYSLIVASTFAAAIVRIVTVVTGKTGIGVQRRLMTIPARGTAVIHPAPAFIGDARMRTVIRCVPILSGMTCRTIQPEHPCMEGGITVTTRAGSGQPVELTGAVTLFAGQACMPPSQREVAQIVIKGGIFPIGRIMTRGAVRPILPTMFIILLVTGVTV